MYLLNIINNCKIKHKLAIIYVFCVCVPMLVTDSMIIMSIRQNALEKQEITMNNMLNRIAYNVNTNIEGCLSVVTSLYTDKEINKFLTKDHRSDITYYDNYTGLIQNNILKYYYNSQRINSITLYADNHTITNGGSFWRIDSIKDTQWYKAFHESGQDLLVVAYYNEQNQYISKMRRTISVIEKLNYFNGQGPEKLIKVDLEYKSILNDLLNEKVDGEIYICNDEYILFSNKTSENSLRQFTPVSELNLKKPAYEKKINVGREEWKIYIIPTKVEIWPMIEASKVMIWFMIIINLLLPTMIISFISRSFTERIKLIEVYLDKVKREEFEIIKDGEGNDEIGTLIKSYNLMVTKIKELIEVVLKKNAEKQALELARKEAELKALQSQVNPHFMFNTLESIRMRSLIKKEDETADIIGALAIILRKSLSWNCDNITIEEEIRFIKEYANIQKYRFGDKISFGFYIMPECEKFKIPKFSILTFVENACIHGLESISNQGNIFVTISKDEESLFIEVSDSGCGIPEEKLEQIRSLTKTLELNKLSETKSTGVLNALIRMNLYCEGNFQFQIDSELNVGTDIMIQIPLDKINVEGENV